jgi:predicted transposase YbfD/YdcC
MLLAPIAAAASILRRGRRAGSCFIVIIRYFLSSCHDDPAVLGAAIRAHWSVENVVHWALDITFREDDSRVRDCTAARNLALVRIKIALNLLGRDRSSTAKPRLV